MNDESGAAGNACQSDYLILSFEAGYDWYDCSTHYSDELHNSDVVSRQEYLGHFSYTNRELTQNSIPSYIV